MAYTFDQLLAATAQKNLSEIKNILECNPPLAEYKSESGVPFVCEAAKTGSLPIIKYVVEYSRASLNVYDSKRRNVLHYAVISGEKDVVQYLVERCGLNPLEGDCDIITPYELAYNNSSSDSHNSPEGFAHTPNEFSCNSNSSDIYKYLEQYIGTPFEKMYKNPVRTGFFPDPSIVRVGEDYYMVNSSFIFFPCIPISHSRDLVNWEIIGHAITNPEWSRLSGLEGGRGYWAPDISYDDGWFYITATYRLNDDGMPYRLQMVTRSQKPEGPYCEPVFLEEDGIDPSIFHENGRHYMLLNRGARIFELNSDCTRIISEPQMLFYGDMKRAPEGPHLIKKDGYYYLFEAEGGTGPGHRETVSRSKNLLGPYTPCPYNPILRREDVDAPITRCGHAKPFTTPDGRWFMVYLCGRRFDGKYTFLGRETALDEITWTPDGWPIVNCGHGPAYIAPLPLPVKDNNKNFFSNNDYFTPREHRSDYVYINNEEISLLSSPAPLNSVDARNIYLRRQTSFNFDYQAKVKAASIPEGSEAGITCFYDENTYLTLSVCNKNNEYSIRITEHIGSEDRELTPACGADISKADTLTLKVQTRGMDRFLIFSTDSFLCTHTLNNVFYLCDEGLSFGKRFTGACVGLFAYGPAEFRAVFSNIEYKDL